MEYPWWALAVVTVISSGLGSWLGAYLKGKASNLATKEDIEAITKKVEDVKAEVGFHSQHRLAIKEKEREVFFAFVDDCLATIHEKLSYDFASLTYYDDQIIRDHQKRLNTAFARIAMDYNRLLMYFSEDDELLKAAETVRTVALETRDKSRQCFQEYAMYLLTTCQAMQELYSRDEKKKVDPQSVETLKNHTAKQDMEYREEMQPSIDRFNDSLEQFIEVAKRRFTYMSTDRVTGKSQESHLGISRN